MKLNLRKRHYSVLIGGLLLLLCTLLLVLQRNGRVGTHPEFGPVLAARASDLNQSRSDPIGRFLRAHLPARVVGSSWFPYRFKDQPQYLRLGGDLMEWSIGSFATGWLYFWSPATWPRTEIWEFAPANATNLWQVSRASFPQKFYRANDPGLRRAFGFESSTNAIRVEEGQVLFARNPARTNRLYLLHLYQQAGNELTVHYCTVLLK